MINAQKGVRKKKKKKASSGHGERERENYLGESALPSAGQYTWRDRRRLRARSNEEVCALGHPWRRAHRHRGRLPLHDRVSRRERGRLFPGQGSSRHGNTPMARSRRLLRECPTDPEKGTPNSPGLIPWGCCCCCCCCKGLAGTNTAVGSEAQLPASVVLSLVPLVSLALLLFVGVVVFFLLAAGILENPPPPAPPWP